MDNSNRFAHDIHSKLYGEEARPLSSQRTKGSGLLPMQFFREIKSYVDFQPEDEQALLALYPRVKPHFPEIIKAFYDALWDNPRTQMVFEGPEQIERLRKSLGHWLDTTFQGPYDEDYFNQRLIIGRVHVNVGLLPHFMFGAMNVIRRYLVDWLFKQDDMPDSERQANVHAIEKILDLELTIMVQSYWDSMMELKLQVPAALATGLAHEIRNPLNAINLNIALMERRLRAIDDDTSAIDPILEVMRSEIMRIRGLTSEIMDFAKPISISPRWSDAKDLIDELIAVHGPTLEVSNISFTSHVSGSTRVWCDVDRFKQVLVNLMTNAVEAVEEAGQIEIKIEGTNEGSIFHFRDNGQGMPPGLRYRVFDLFFTTKASGTGLGLPIVRKIIEAHEGAIDVVTRPGHGTTFSIYLPYPAHEHPPYSQE